MKTTVLHYTYGIRIVVKYMKLNTLTTKMFYCRHQKQNLQVNGTAQCQKKRTARSRLLLVVCPRDTHACRELATRIRVHKLRGAVSFGFSVGQSVATVTA